MQSRAMESKRPELEEGFCERHSKRLRFHVTSGEGSSPTRREDYTVAWICALPLELSASRAMLDEEHQSQPNFAGDDNTYVLGRVDKHNVVMTCLPGEYGMNNAAIVATNLKRSFPRIRATLMVGIGGGSPCMADQWLGDVVVGARVLQYDMGKIVMDGEFQATASAKLPAPLLLSAVSSLRSKHGQNACSTRLVNLLKTRLPSYGRPGEPDRLFRSDHEHTSDSRNCDGCDPGKLQPRGARLRAEPQIHYGVVASGNRIMKNGKERDNIAQRHSVLCFEMEAAGMMDNLHCLPIRGICDYADSHKNKAWQPYAAATASAYARELLEVLSPLEDELNPAATYCAGSRDLNSVGNDTNALGRRLRLLESLEFPQIDARKTAIRAAHTKTCRWILQHPGYKNWLSREAQSRNHGFLWIRGKAGAGKSTMMKFLYLETKRKSGGLHTAIASFFFNARGGYLEHSMIGMYRSLLVQLLKRFPELQSVLDDTDIVPWSQQVCPELNALKELLRSAIIALDRRSFICLIDALDECDEQQVRDMVQFFEDLSEITTEDGIYFRVCFSSRPYPYIEIRQGVLLALEEQSGHADDLARYVKSHLRIANYSLLEELELRIIDKAAGIFMWIVLVVEILNEESSHGALAIWKRLAEIPTKLSDLFKSMLMRDQNNMDRMLLCILCILCAKRPLSPAEFRHALWAGLLEQNSVDPDLPADTDMDACLKLVTSSSKGLAEMTKAPRPVVQFIHESVRDYLVKEKGLQDIWPELGFDWESPGHERLKRCCATYLNHSRVQLIIKEFEAEDYGEDAMTKQTPFLEYACQAVLYHANVAAQVVPQHDFLHQFFTSAGAGIRIINLFEKFKTRQYGQRATALYILADRGLDNLVRTQMKTEPATYVPEERYEYPLFAALANSHKGVVAALLGLPSTVCNGVDVTEGLKYRKDLGEYQGRTPLSWAAQEGRLDIVRLLLRGGADPEETDRKQQRPLLRALQNGHGAVVQLLIDKGADVSAHDKDGLMTLIRASQNGHKAVVQFLIDKGADVDARDNVGSTALVGASRNGHEAVVQLLIGRGADVNVRDKDGSMALIEASRKGYGIVTQLLIDRGANINAQGTYGSTALIRASRNGHEAVVQLLIDRGADVNARNGDGSTALIEASRDGREVVVQLLIDKGVDINAQDKVGATALVVASRNGYEVVVRLLIDKGANDPTALIWASRNGHEAVVQLLIDRGADVNARNGDGLTALIEASREGREPIVQLLIDRGANCSTALIWASKNGHEAVVQVLIDRGADVNARNGDGSTALIEASREGREAVVQLLIDRGANVNAHGMYEATALIWASRQGHVAVAQLLIERSADINGRAVCGSTALIQASLNGHARVVQLLINRGADVNARDMYGLVALIRASRNGHLATVQVLINEGADINAQDNDGSTALVGASRNGHEAVVQLLIDRGVDINGHNCHSDLGRSA